MGRIWLPGECAHETSYLVPAHELIRNEPAYRCRDCGAFVGAPPSVEQEAAKKAEVSATPEPTDLVRELRETLGMFAGAMPISPREAWNEALEKVRRLQEGRCWVCMEKDAKK